MDRISRSIAKKEKQMSIENEVKKTEEKDVPKYFHVKNVGCYGMRETFEEALAEAQRDAMGDNCDQYVMKAIKLVKKPSAEVFTTAEDIH